MAGLSEAGTVALTVTPLDPVMGAEVAGLDLSQPLSAATMSELRALLNRFALLCFRDQSLTMDQQVAFSENWGPLAAFTMDGHVLAGANDRIQVGSNADERGQPNGRHPDPTAMFWHSDGSWRARPAFATILYGVDIPSRGGDTLICNGTAAYEALPAERKRALDDVMAIHSVEYSRRAAGGNPATEHEKRIAPPTRHPLARIHPETGRRAIFCGCHAWKIEGLSEAEGRRVLDEIQAYATQERFVYRHVWRRHDVLMWDNRCTMHAATPFDTETELRTIWRTVVDGEATA